MDSPDKSRIIYFDWLRIISAFFVVMIHVSAQYWYDIEVSTSKWQFMSAYDIIGMAGVPVFFMLSGALMLDDSRKTDFKKTLRKVLSMIIIYHFWLLFYNLFSYVIGEKAFSDFSLKEVLYLVLNGQGIYHLWFLPELTLLYLISPLLKEVFKEKRFCEYYLILYLIFGIIIPSIFLFDVPFKTTFDSLYRRSSLEMLTGYIGYFVAGHYIHRFVNIRNTTKTRLLLLLTAIIGYAITISVNAFDAITKGSASTLANTPLDFSEFITAVSIFSLFKLLNKPVLDKSASLVLYLSGLTFGIYLMHPLVIMIFMKLGMNTLMPHTCIMIPVFTLLIFGITALLTAIIQKLPILRLLIK